MFDNVNFMECSYRYVCGGGCPVLKRNDDTKDFSTTCGIFEDEKFVERLFIAYYLVSLALKLLNLNIIKERRTDKWNL